MEIPLPSRGSNILGWASSLCAYLRSERLLSGSGILIKHTPSGITLSTQPGNGEAFTGVYWFKGKRYELAGDPKDFWYHDAVKNSGSWSDGPIPTPFYGNCWWRKTTECHAVEYILC